MIKRIPLASSLKALVKIFFDCQFQTPIHNKIPTGAIMPYVKIGAFTCKPEGSKDTDIADITAQIHIYSDYDGELEMNEIADDVVAVIGAVKIDLMADGFTVMSQGYDMFESFEDEYGYHGIVTFVARVQNIKQES